jgi:hypothetical protein
MLRKIVLVGLMSVPMIGALTTQTPSPVVVVMGCLILLAISVAMRRKQPG